jgi:DNA (cytosine-5)-methyltransferase 1
MKRLQSFPDSYRFTGGYRHAAARIGNAVPPRFMQAVAEHIWDEILARAPGNILKDIQKPHRHSAEEVS